MWDLIVSVPDHCLYFYFTLFCHIIDIAAIIIMMQADVVLRSKLYSVFIV